MTDEVKMIYRTIAQSESGLTITAETKYAVTIEQAEQDVEKHVLPKNLQSNLKPYITMAVATAEGWSRGYVNFCPRCGRRLGGDDGAESAEYYGDCFDCGAELEITISNVHGDFEEEVEE